MKYKHLSYSDRQEMEKLYLQGWHMNDIAAKLGVSLATVFLLGARHQREYQRHDSAAVSKGNELCGSDERADCAGRKLDK